MKAGINRRQFMQKSLVGAAAAPLVTHVLGHEAEAFTQPVSPSDRIQVGLIGSARGAMQGSGLLDAAVAVPGVEVIGVCDAYKGRVTRALQNLGGKAKDYGDYRSLLADKSIDVVIVATPDHIMPDIQPYKAVGIDGSWVTSRSHHRALLKAHGMIEVGNEAPKWLRERQEEGK